MEEKILAAFFLCEHTHSGFLNYLRPVWDDVISRPASEKLEMGSWTSEIENIFSFKDELSEGIDPKKFSLSFLSQPKLFLRTRPGHHATVLQKLHARDLKYEVLSRDCIALPNASKVDTVIDLDEEAVVQDYNSQKVGEFLKLAMGNRKWEIDVWDCCAASGGKSIMAYDIDSLIRLTVSDKRESILENLKERFTTAGIKYYHSFVADLSHVKASGQSAPGNLKNKYFNLVIADVPCTGSGTWARTPEQLFYFDQNEIKRYSGLQKQIVENAVKYVKPGGYLLYITCSVFKKENEELAGFIEEKLAMKLLKMDLLKGYEMQADTMFAALFIRH